MITGYDTKGRERILLKCQVGLLTPAILCRRDWMTWRSLNVPYYFKELWKLFAYFVSWKIFLSFILFYWWMYFTHHSLWYIVSLFISHRLLFTFVIYPYILPIGLEIGVVVWCQGALANWPSFVKWFGRKVFLWSVSTTRYLSWW